MSTDQLAKQMVAEEKAASEEIAKKLTEALNAKSTQKEADRLNKSSGGWPYPPDAAMLKLYRKTADQAWGKLRSKYDGFKVDIDVEANKGKPPRARVTARYDGSWKGGQSRPLRKGETIAGIAKQVYGHDCYAGDVWLANEKLLGRKCTQIPAGFAIELPRIWVPAWKTAPKVSIPAGARSTAVDILYPTMVVDIEEASAAKALVPMGAAMIEITFEVKGALKAQRKGSVNAAFNLRTYEAEIKKAAGPIQSAWKLNLQDKSGTLEIQVFNEKWRNLDFSTKLVIRNGSFGASFGTKKVSVFNKDTQIEGEITLTGTVRIWPNPKKLPEKVRQPRRDTRPLIDPETMEVIETGVKGAVVVGGVVIATIVVVKTAPVSVPALMSGGGAKLATAGGAVGLVALFGGS
jgi:hypothetical protein